MIPAFRLFAAFAALAATMPAFASTLQVSVRDANGQAVPDAVVMVHPAAGIPAGAGRLPMRAVVTQANIQFDPFVLVVPVGAEVEFPNRDRVRHHVYSFSPANRFELQLYAREETRTVRFDRAGPVALGCNIHDGMVAHIRVVDTPYALKTDASGQARIANLPAGAATVTVWHPQARIRRNETQAEVAIPATGMVARTVSFPLRAGR